MWSVQKGEVKVEVISYFSGALVHFTDRWMEEERGDQLHGGPRKTTAEGPEALAVSLALGVKDFSGEGEKPQDQFSLFFLDGEK